MLGYGSLPYATQRLVCLFVLIAAMLSPLALGTPPSTLQMKIDDIKFDNGAVVKFLERGSEQTLVKLEDLRKMNAGETDDHQYTVYADLDATQVFPSFENYIFYVRPVSAGASEPLTKVTIQATPYDSFPDQSKSVQIHLLDGVHDHIIELLIPVHSFRAGNFLRTQVNAAARVHLSGDTISVDLQNKYLIPVKITGATVVPPAQSSHWTSQPVLVSTIPIILSADENNNRTSLVWTVQPKAWGVLRDSLIPFSRTNSKDGSSSDSSTSGTEDSDAAENLEFSIDYVSEQGGFPHTVKVQRSVYFYPSVPALVGVVTLGALGAGLVMFYGIRKDSGVRKFLKYLGLNLVFACIIELLAIALFSFDKSKIQIGVVNLNPTLLIPAFCLGAVSVFYGFQLVEKFLGKAGLQSPAPATDGAKK
jgi:hypothetical protein